MRRMPAGTLTSAPAADTRGTDLMGVPSAAPRLAVCSEWPLREPLSSVLGPSAVRTMYRSPPKLTHRNSSTSPSLSDPCTTASIASAPRGIRTSSRSFSIGSDISAENTLPGSGSLARMRSFDSKTTVVPAGTRFECAGSIKILPTGNLWARQNAAPGALAISDNMKRRVTRPPCQLPWIGVQSAFRAG